MDIITVSSDLRLRQEMSTEHSTRNMKVIWKLSNYEKSYTHLKSNLSQDSNQHGLLWWCGWFCILTEKFSQRSERMTIPNALCVIKWVLWWDGKKWNLWNCGSCVTVFSICGCVSMRACTCVCASVYERRCGCLLEKLQFSSILCDVYNIL